MRQARIALLVLLTLCAACTGHMAKIAPEPPSRYATTTTGRGSACGVNLFGFIPIAVNSRAQRAYDAALRSARGTGLTDVTVTERWYWAYVATVFCTDAAGLGYAAQ